MYLGKIYITMKKNKKNVKILYLHSFIFNKYILYTNVCKDTLTLAFPFLLLFYLLVFFLFILKNTLLRVLC